MKMFLTNMKVYLIVLDQCFIDKKLDNNFTERSMHVERQAIQELAQNITHT